MRSREDSARPKHSGFRRAFKKEDGRDESSRSGSSVSARLFTCLHVTEFGRDGRQLDFRANDN